jgi:hypothetical protein
VEIKNEIGQRISLAEEAAEVCFLERKMVLV